MLSLWEGPGSQHWYYKQKTPAQQLTHLYPRGQEWPVVHQENLSRCAGQEEREGCFPSWNQKWTDRQLRTDQANNGS